MKNYKLIRTYESPSGTIHAGCVKPVSRWLDDFPDLEESDLKIKTDWFEEVATSHEDRVSLCRDQIAQIDCRRFDCFHNQGLVFHHNGVACVNVSPAIYIGGERVYECFSYTPKEELDEEDEDWFK